MSADVKSNNLQKHKPEEEFAAETKIPEVNKRIHRYVPLVKLFKEINPERTHYIIENLKDYVEEYREERRGIDNIENYIALNKEYLRDVKGAVTQKLESERLKSRRKAIKGVIIAGLGYGMSIVLMAFFPVLTPFILDKIVIGSLVTEESARNIYQGLTSKRAIEKEIEFIEKMPLKKVAYALEDLCYYPAKTNVEKDYLRSYNSHVFRKALRNKVEYLTHQTDEKVYTKMRIPKELDKFGRRVYHKLLYYMLHNEEKLSNKNENNGSFYIILQNEPNKKYQDTYSK